MNNKEIFYTYKNSLYCFADNLKLCKELLDAGVKIIQFRNKEIDDDTFYSTAKQMFALVNKYHEVIFFINDRVNIALEIRAHGIHIGQEDDEYEKVIDRIPENMIVGVSAKTHEDAKRAEQAGATYIGVGAAFPTTTKENAIVIGLENLSEIINSVEIPVAAIGGINLENLSLVQKAGADYFAIVSDINNADNISKKIKQYNTLIERGKNEYSH